MRSKGHAHETQRRPFIAGSGQIAPSGEWSGHAARCASRDQAHRLVRAFGPIVGVACGGNLILPWLPLNVMQHNRALGGFP